MNAQSISALREAAKGHLEEGTAFAKHADRRSLKTVTSCAESFPVIVIGAGQSGLSVGYHLRRHGIPFVILDAHARVGDVWRKRWDSLRLFTPAPFDGLDGMPYPATTATFPTKDEMADYLEAYAARFDLPVRTSHRVESLTRDGDSFVIEAGGRRFRAQQIVVAMSNYQRPKVPDFASGLSPDITQIHSRDYRGPFQLNAGNVLIVGAGNSGAEIAREVAAAGHPVVLSGRSTGEVPFRVESFLGLHVLCRPLFRVIFHRVLTTGTPFGRKARPKLVSHGGPLIRVKSKELAALGVERAPRMSGVHDGRPVLEGGRTLDVANIVWCNGFDAGLDWIRLPLKMEHGRPVQDRGVVAEYPGLYFTGQHFLYALSSAMIHGAGRDARYVVGRIANRLAASAEGEGVGRTA